MNYLQNGFDLELQLILSSPAVGTLYYLWKLFVPEVFVKDNLCAICLTLRFVFGWNSVVY